VEGNGTTTEPKSYSFTDGNVTSGKYSYRLKQINFDGSFEYSKEVEVEVNYKLEFSLSQNYPNPFNPSTMIKYSIPKDGYVNLKIYNTLGQQVAELVNGIVKAGSHQVTFNAGNLSSGVYYYRIESGNYVSVRKMMILK
ncbi:MAG TPA: T9SS type A sorting domain-containing protein, partial [Ignavibacteriaceae bacterium]|nr:T9SS type A sorting domain-containing protein [Ignavibacteriaceae bacterium]